jgi:hypothetical protein
MMTGLTGLAGPSAQATPLVAPTTTANIAAESMRML